MSGRRSNSWRRNRVARRASCIASCSASAERRGSRRFAVRSSLFALRQEAKSRKRQATSGKGKAKGGLRFLLLLQGALRLLPDYGEDGDRIRFAFRDERV